jgi:FAD/FMN-containing dehydrogenase
MKELEAAPSPVRMAEAMDRRTFLKNFGRSAASVWLGSALASCTGGSPTTPPSGGPTGTAPSGGIDWAELRARLRGTVATRGAPGFREAAELFNTRFDSIHPAAIARCRSAADVAACIRFARDHDVPIAVRSGGHSYAGYSTGRGLVIDVARMNRVAVDPSTGTASVGAGARLVDMYSTLASAGVLVPGGSCPTVGIAGLTLGGGIGVVGRKYGLTCDNLHSVQMVTADGSVLTCDESSNADLFWACRGGGGGNFGVATRFTFGTHPATALSLFTLAWDWTSAPAVLAAWMDWMLDAPDELWSNCLLLPTDGGPGPSGSAPSCRVTGVYVGETDALARSVAALVARTPAPSSRFIGLPGSFLHAMLVEAGCGDLSVAQCHLPSQNPAGVLKRDTFAAKSDFADEPIAAGGVAVLVDAVEQRQRSSDLTGAGSRSTRGAARSTVSRRRPPRSFTAAPCAPSSTRLNGARGRRGRSSTRTSNGCDEPTAECGRSSADSPTRTTSIPRWRTGSTRTTARTSPG